MPAKSEAQRKFLYSTKGATWVQRHHYDNPGKLPARVKPKKVKSHKMKAKKKGK